MPKKPELKTRPDLSDQERLEMRITRVCNRFSYSGDLCDLGRHFHRLSLKQRQFAVELMLAGFLPEAALAKANTAMIEPLLPVMLD